MWEAETKLNLWLLSPLHAYKSSERVSHRLGGELNYPFFSPLLPLAKPKFFGLLQHTSAEVPYRVSHS